MPRKRKPDTFVSDLKTGIGNILLRQLIEDGWSVKDQYDESAIDKGIDYDFFELEKGPMLVFMEWDNWNEWSINVSNQDAQATVTTHLKVIQSIGN